MRNKGKNYISPLLSFDFYLENYHKMLEQLRKDVDLKQLESIVKPRIGTYIQDLILQERYDALVLTKPDQHIVWVSEGFQEMTGYSKSYAIGKKPSFLQGTNTSENTKQEIREQLRVGHKFSGSILNYRKNGETYQCQIKIVPIYDFKNVLMNFLALEKELRVA